jgi:hypothetical protein
MSELIDYPSPSSMLLGGGYDFIKRQIKLSPLSRFDTVTESVGSVATDLDFVERASELSSFLKVGAEGAYDSAAFRASVKSEFVQETQINEYSLLFVVHCACVKQVEIAAGLPTLNGDAQAMAQAGSFNAFRNSFGDHYVSALTRGGELFGLIQITTRSQQAREALKAELGTGGVGWNAHADFESKVAKRSSELTIRLHTRVNGVSGVGYENPTSVSGLFKLVEEFPAKVAAAGTLVKAELRPISELPSYQGQVASFDDDTRYALARLSDHFLDYTMLLNNIDFIVAHPGQFDLDTVPMATVKAQRPRVQDKLHELELLSTGLVGGEVKHADARVAGFLPADVFADTLTLPNVIETVQPPPIVMHPLRFNTRGDAEMDGHWPRIDIDATLSSPDQRTLALQVHLTMTENKADWTTFEDNWPPTGSATERRPGTMPGFDLRNTGLQIVDFRPKTGALHAQAGHNDHDWHVYPGTDLIASADCLSDINGKETGRIGARSISFNPVKVILAPAPRAAVRGLAVGGAAAFSQARQAVLQFWVRRR